MLLSLSLEKLTGSGAAARRCGGVASQVSSWVLADFADFSGKGEEGSEGRSCGDGEGKGDVIGAARGDCEALSEELEEELLDGGGVGAGIATTSPCRLTGEGTGEGDEGDDKEEAAADWTTLCGWVKMDSSGRVDRHRSSPL